MRDRKQVEHSSEVYTNDRVSFRIILEVLLDIRDLLAKDKEV